MTKKAISSSKASVALPEGYAKFLASIKRDVANARIKAALSVNSELVRLYWSIGKQIVERQEKETWGAKVIEKLSIDLTSAFQGMKGFSTGNIKRMRQFAALYPDIQIGSQLVIQLPWGHIVVLMALKDSSQRDWYASKTLENGWSRNLLVIHIERELYEAQGKATTNFELTMPKPQSDLSRELFKNPYNLEFLDISAEAEERDIERGLVAKIRDFLLELGSGFAFLGNQYHLEVGGDDFYIDLLFYHTKLHCYIVIELKNGPFKPEYAGKLNFYLTAVDMNLRGPTDEKTIGLILCKERNHVVAEYALSDMTKSMGVATFKLPKKLKDTLPSIEELEAKLSENDSK